ncbi:MAG TPA: filamentous hemagglutinin N-terminal domain-containing protein [Steroidobacteraceae bacterium]
MSANPTGAQVVAGQASIVGSPNQLLITNSPGAIINWQGFSIMPGELTRFIQQSSSSSVLNRVTGQDPTKILGALQSNGKVFLINPNGIMFGAGARVDVNGLVASTLNLSNADFLAGKLKFSGAGNAGDISNQGAITTPGGGQVYLIGSSVTNGGVITSPGGDVVLAAGQSVDLADSSDPDVRVVISAPGSQALNVGKVVADSGRVGIYGALVNQMGLVSANSAVAGANGKIVFRSSGDTLLGAGSVTSATGAGSGGVVEVTGNRVGLTDDAVVDVSGQTGGGTVLLGGDEHGANATIQNASQTYVGAAAQVRADALQTGNGGKVVVWSDRQTQMYGSISARGAGQGVDEGGNGGFVETSSKGYLDFRGVADLRAPSGAAGTLLLDPSDITIASDQSSGDVTISGSPPFDITAANAVSVLSTAALQNQLGLGNVTVSTSSAASAPSGGTITVVSPLAWANSNTLRLEADQGITINAPITAAAGTLSLATANGDITQSGGKITAAAVAAVASNGSVALTNENNVIAVIAGRANGSLGFSLANNGSFTVGTVPGGGQVSDVSGIVSVNTSSFGFGVVLQAPNVGDITIAAPVDAGISGVLVGASGAVIQATGGLISGGDLTVIADGAAGIGSSNAPLRTAVGTLRNATSIGDVHISNTGPLTVNFIEAGGVASVSASGSMTTAIPTACDCAVHISGSSVVLATEGSMLVNPGGFISAESDVALYAGYQPASGTYTNAATLAVDGDVSGGTVGLFAGGAITASGALTGAVTQTPSLYSPVPSLPTLSECMAAPTTLGCSALLPTLVECTSNPATAGCSAVLPSLSICTASPSTAGCVVVLPSLATCVATPSVGGCGAVLPTLMACTSNPTAAGCNVVLPTLVVCTSNHSAPGCGAVLPSLATCTATPSAAGCSAVLPTVAQCAATPTLAGCSSVLPPASVCTVNPSAAGCIVLQSTPVAQTLNTTVNLINTVTSAATSGATSPLVSASSAPDTDKPSSESKVDSKKDAQSSTDKAATKAAENDTSKKMYCN